MLSTLTLVRRPIHLDSTATEIFGCGSQTAKSIAGRRPAPCIRGARIGWLYSVSTRAPVRAPKICPYRVSEIFLVEQIASAACLFELNPRSNAVGENLRIVHVILLRHRERISSTPEKALLQRNTLRFLSRSTFASSTIVRLATFHAPCTLRSKSSRQPDRSW